MNPWLWILVILAVISLIVVIVVTARLEKKEKERQESFISTSNPWKVLSKELDVVGLEKITDISAIDINEISEIDKDNGTLTFKEIYFSNPDGLNNNYNDSSIVKNIVFDHCIIETNDMSKFVKYFTKESNLVSFDGSTSVFLSISFDDMFNGYVNLKNVYIGSAPIAISAKRMFKGCTSLKGELINIIKSQLGFKCLIDATSMFEGVQLWPGTFYADSNEWMSSIKYADRMFASDTKIPYNTSIYSVSHSIESGKEMFKGYDLDAITFDYCNDRTNFYHAVDSANSITFTGDVRIHDEEQLDVCVDWSKVNKIDFGGLNSALDVDGRSIYPFIIDTSNLKVTFHGDLLIYDSESKQIQWNSKGSPSLIVKSKTIGEGDCKFEAQYPMIFERDSEHLYNQIGYSERIDEVKWCYVLGLEDKVEFNGVHFIDCNSNQFHPNIESISIIDCTFDNPIEWNKVFKDHKELISVKLDFDSEIENMDEMFSDCSNLESVDISSRFMSNVFSMNCVFDGCTNLKNIKWSPNKLNHISLKRAFYRCDSLTKLPMENILIGDCEEMANGTYITELTINIDSKSDLSKLLNGNNRLTCLHLRGNSAINSFGELYENNGVPQSFKCIDFGDMYIDNNTGGILFTDSYIINSITYLPNPIDGKPIFRIVGGKLYWNGNGTSYLPTTKIIKKIDSNDGHLTIKFDDASYSSVKEKKPSELYFTGGDPELKITNISFNGLNDTGFNSVKDYIEFVEFVECTFDNCSFEKLFSSSNIKVVLFIGGTFNECDFTKAFYNCQSLRSVIFDDTRFINCNKMASMFEEDNNLIEVVGLKIESENLNANRLFYKCSNLVKTNKINFNFNLNECDFSYMFYGCTRLWFDEDIEIEIANSNYRGLFMQTNIRSLTIVANGFELECNSYIRDIASGERLRMIDFGDLITSNGIKGDLSMYSQDLNNYEDIFKNDNPYGINGEPVTDDINEYDNTKILTEIGYTPLIIKWHTIHSIYKMNSRFETNQIFKIKRLSLDWNSMVTTIDKLGSSPSSISSFKPRAIPQGYSIKNKFAIARSDEPSCGMFPNSDKLEFDNIIVISNSDITNDYKQLYSNYKFIKQDIYNEFTTDSPKNPIIPILIFANHEFYNFQYLIDYQYFDESSIVHKIQDMIFNDDITNYNTGDSKHLTEDEIKSVYSCITPEELGSDNMTETKLEVAKGILDEFYKNVEYCY